MNAHVFEQVKAGAILNPLNTRRTKRPARYYMFQRDTFGRNRPCCTVDSDDAAIALWTYECTDATYNRFVRLANSGSYHVEILDSDYGIAWEMRRK